MAEDETSVLITGFGPYLNIKTNPSFEIVLGLPSEITHKGHRINVCAYPEPLKVSYHDCATLVPKLLAEKEPDVVIHIGLAFDRSYFAIEKGAPRDGYHAIPDEDRKVFTKAENKKLWGKSPERLDPGFNFEKALEGWKKAVSGGGKGKGKGKGKGREEDLRVSDDVGVYICGFVYYLSLERLRESKKRSLVVFLHVPPLEGREEVERGVQIVIGLVKALVEQKEK